MIKLDKTFEFHETKFYRVVWALDNECLANILDCWKAGEIFSIEHLDQNLSQQDLQLFENRSKINVVMAKMKFE